MLALSAWKSMLTWPLVEQGEVVCPDCFHSQSDTYSLFNELRCFLCRNRLFISQSKGCTSMLPSGIGYVCEYEGEVKVDRM